MLKGIMQPPCPSVFWPYIQGDNPIVAFIYFTYLHVFVYGLFNDTVSDVENKPSNYWIIKTSEIDRMWKLNGHGVTLCSTENFSGYTELITSVKITYIWGTNPGPQSLWYTRFCKVTPNISGQILYVNYLAPRILTWFLDCWKTCAPLVYISPVVLNGTSRLPVTIITAQADLTSPLEFETA